MLTNDPERFEFSVLCLHWINNVTALHLVSIIPIGYKFEYPPCFSDSFNGHNINYCKQKKNSDDGSDNNNDNDNIFYMINSLLSILQKWCFFSVSYKKYGHYVIESDNCNGSNLFFRYTVKRITCSVLRSDIVRLLSTRQKHVTYLLNTVVFEYYMFPSYHNQINVYRVEQSWAVHHSVNKTI